MHRSVVFAAAVGAVFAAAVPARAGLYHPDVLVAFDLDEHGYALPLGHTSFMSLVNLAGEADRRPDQFAESDKHRELMRTTAERLKNRRQLSPKQIVELSADLLRLRRDEGKLKEAVNLLGEMKTRPPAGYEFLVLSHLAHGHMLMRDADNLRQAYELEQSALYDYDFPSEIPGLTKAQLTWYRRLERDYYLPLLRHRWEIATRKGPAHIELDPIFPGPAAKGASPVRYVGESGEYEPGTIAEAEKMKLPPDAISVVQQLILWDPDDSRLWWQLAELYNALGDVESAAQVFGMLLDFTSPLRLNVPEVREHANAVTEAFNMQRTIAQQMAATKQREQEAARREAARKQRTRELAVGCGVALVLLFVTYWQTREFIRRRKARRAAPVSSPKHVE